MKKIFSLLLAVACVAATAHAQNIVVPAAVKNAFQSKYPDATDVKWGKENSKEFEAEFKLGNTSVSANFKTDGSWVETETVVPITDLPAAVSTAITTKNPGAVITLAEKLDMPGNKTLYEVSFRVNGKRKSMELHPDGTKAD